MVETLWNFLAKANQKLMIVENGEQKMLNLLTKTKPWMVASLIVATSVFGQNNGSSAKSCAPKPAAKPCPQPCPPTQACDQDPCCPSWPTPVLNAAYAYPARIQTRCPWDVSFDASFIFWQATQDNMELGIADSSVAPDITSSTATFERISGNVINMGAKFRPGFKVGMGFNFDYDNWDMRVEYTWFHGKNSNSSNGANGGRILSFWGTPQLMDGLMFDTISSSWRLKMDIADFDLGRWQYVGTKYTVRPSFGVRANWIRQRVAVTPVRTTTNPPLSTPITETIVQKASSWGLGPKVALDGNWNLGCGFRLFGNSEADLLFTDYTKLSYNDSDSAQPLAPVAVNQDKLYAVKPHVDLGLGLGWGTYLDCNNWYMDFAFAWDFQVFFDQNMFRKFNDTTMFGSTTMPNGNLYVQGLTASFKLDF